jgi:hypothetical protein
MARTAKTPLALVRDAGVSAATAPTTIDATLVTNGVTLTGASQGKGKIVLLVANTAVAAKNVTIKGGPKWGANGDLVVSVAANTGVQAITLGDVARHQQADNAVYVDFAAGTTGTIQVLRVPR